MTRSSSACRHWKLRHGLPITLSLLTTHLPTGPPAAFLHDGRDVGPHPVVIAIFAAVFYQACPRLAPANGAPQILERGGRHIGVANQAVRLAQQLGHIKTADALKSAVAVGNLALEVGGGNQQLIGRIVVVVLGNGQIQPHVVLTFNGYGLRPIL